ncbi:MAG: hypothetical protein JWM05_3155 [Acidimicrobiales bacterium]|nr:hypothetical protein [Acidimicrobiales bacterium]
MVAGEGPSAAVVLRRGGVEQVIGRVTAVRPSLALVDALARLELVARDLGCSIRLRDPSADLRELLDLVGLGDLVAGPPGLLLEAEREAEGREQRRGVEEVVPPRDPPA